MLPLAPGLFSITRGWPSAGSRRSPASRITISEGPPGGKLMTTRIGLVGHSCASAPAGKPRQKTIDSSPMRAIVRRCAFMVPPRHEDTRFPRHPARGGAAPAARPLVPGRRPRIADLLRRVLALEQRDLARERGPFLAAGRA